MLSRGEARNQGKARLIILANAFEALLGALHEDGGLTVVEEFVRRIVFPKIDEVIRLGRDQDPKSVFQERVQGERGIMPHFEVQSITGSDHAPRFSIGIYVGKECWGVGEGSSKQEAETMTALAALRDRYGLVMPVPRSFGRNK